MAEERRLADFSPDEPVHTNGARARRRLPRRLLAGVPFGALLGALLGASIVPRVQWLNLASVGGPWRPMVVGLAAGALVGALRRDSFRWSLLAGAVAALVALWGVYGIVRLSVSVLFVERSVARVVSADLARLFAIAVPSGAAGAAFGWWFRAGMQLVAPSIRARRDR